MFRFSGLEFGERRVLAWGGTALAFTGAAVVSLDIVSHTYFNKRVGVQYLPLAYLINSILLVGTTYLVLRVAGRSDRPRLLPKILIGLAIALVPVWMLVRAEMISAFMLLILASKQFQSVALLAYWLAIGDLLHGRQAKRLAAPMTAGYTLGAIIGSERADWFSQWLGIDALLLVAAAGFALASLATIPLRRYVPKRLDAVAHVPGKRSGGPPTAAIRLKNLWQDSPLFRLLFIGAASAGILGPMLHFQYQYVLTQASSDEQGLVRLYSSIGFYINLGVLTMQLFVASSLFRRIGIPRSIVAAPVIYFLGFTGMSIRLNIYAAVGAQAGTKLQDHVVSDPAMKILFNLFPERIRSAATGMLDGPVKRAGAAIGNVLCMTALQFASAIAVGYVAIPITLIWLIASLRLWRSYPALLLRASARRDPGEDIDLEELVDPSTLKTLSAHLADDNPDPAIELISQAKIEDAAAVLAAALETVPEANRPRLIAALDRLLEKSVTETLRSSEAAAHIAVALSGDRALSSHDRADLVQAYGRLTDLRDASSDPVWERALADESAGVRLAANAALARVEEGAGDLDASLAAAVASEDAVVRRVAREEIRAALLSGEPGPLWSSRLALLTRLLEFDAELPETSEAVAEVAQRHGTAAAEARDAMLRHRDDLRPEVIAATLRYAGCAGLDDLAPWLIENVARGGYGADVIRSAARSGLVALGARAADLLLVELSFGKRSTRDAILPIIRQLEVDQETLRSLYGRELQSLRRMLVFRFALRREPGSEIIRQRLEERTGESLQTALLLLAAIHNADPIAELGERLKRTQTGGGNIAILLEALEALLDPHERLQLMPLMGDRSLELRARSAAAALGIAVPSPADTALALLDDSDELTRTLAAATLPQVGGVLARLAGGSDVEDHPEVLSPVEIALHLRSLPLFDGLTIRQLIDLAGVVREQVRPLGEVITNEGDSEDCLYLIVDGEVIVTHGATELNRLGPRDFFGEIAVLERLARTATVTATTQVRLLRLDRDDLLRLMEELPVIAICICQTLSKRTRDLSKKVDDLSKQLGEQAQISS